MILEEYRFNEIYHKYLVFEVDALTEKCKDVIAVTEEDCFMLSTSIIDETGNIVFPVLSIGPKVDDCFKGLDILEPLTTLSSFEIEPIDFEVVDQPTFKMQVKGANLFETEKCTRELSQTRKMKELDDQRDYHYPDVISVHFLSDGKFHRYLVEMLEFNSRFLEGKMLKEPDRDIGVHEDDRIEAIPIMVNNQLHLLSSKGKLHVSDDAFDKLREYVNEMLEEYPELENEKKS